MKIDITTPKLLEYFNGELSAAEQEYIREWASANESNRQLYEEVRREYLLARLGTRAAFINGDKAAIRKRMGVNVRRKISVRRFAGVAAACVFLACSALLLSRYVFTESGADDAALADMPKNQPIIQLSDGSRHFVGNDPEEFMETNGVTLSVTNGEIRYNQIADADPSGKTAYNKVIIPRGADFCMVTLPDGSRAWLNSDSQLEYPLHFPGNIREVRLQGEGFFDVMRNEGQPFIVRTDHQTITVLGTEFNVNAYLGEPVSTTLVSGSVKINADLRGGESNVLLVPGEQSVLNPLTGELNVYHVETKYFTLWKEGMVSIEDMSMEEILKIVSRKYDVVFDTRGVMINDIVLRGSISGKENLRTVLAILEKVGDVKFKVKKNGEIKIERE